MNRRRLNRKRLILLGLSILALAVAGYLLKDLPGKSSPGHRAERAASTPAQRNDLRRAELKQLSEAIKQYTAEKGPVPVAIPARETGICSSTGASCRTAKLVDLMFLASNGYIAALPSDPVGGSDANATGYTIMRNTSGAIVLGAPRAEDGKAITQAVR